jgi:hypothetical protein
MEPRLSSVDVVRGVCGRGSVQDRRSNQSRAWAVVRCGQVGGGAISRIIYIVLRLLLLLLAQVLARALMF